MIASVVGYYLISKGKLQKEDLDRFYDEISKVRVKLGTIAVSEKFMTQEQADRVNLLQATKDKRFGDIAIEMGYLTEGQLEDILKFQGNPYLAVAQALENMNIMNVSELDELMEEFRVENEMSAHSLEDLKSDDVDRALPLFLPADVSDYAFLAGTALRMIRRCVDNNALPLKAYYVEELPADNGAMQEMEGEVNISTGFAGKKNSLLPIAIKFGKEEFEEIDMDAMDAIAELCNCINGLYAAQLSQRQVTLEMLPPEFSDDMSGFYSDEILVLPMVVFKQKVNFIMTIGSNLKIQQ